jgi:hypothetical protein
MRRIDLLKDNVDGAAVADALIKQSGADSLIARALGGPGYTVVRAEIGAAGSLLMVRSAAGRVFAFQVAARPIAQGHPRFRLAMETNDE